VSTALPLLQHQSKSIMPRNKMVWNEQVKTLASLINNVAADALVTAVLIALVAADTTAAGDATRLGYLVTVPIGLVLALTFSGLAYAVLGQLEEQWPALCFTAHPVCNKTRHRPETERVHRTPETQGASHAHRCRSEALGLLARLCRGRLWTRASGRVRAHPCSTLQFARMDPPGWCSHAAGRSAP
jgi:uncharacterized membrane protein